MDTISWHDAHLIYPLLERRWDWEDQQQRYREFQARQLLMEDAARAIGAAFGEAVTSFNRFFEKMTEGYQDAVGDDSLGGGGASVVQDGAPLLEDPEVLQLASLPILWARLTAQSLQQVVRRSWLQLQRPSWLRWPTR